MATDDGSSVAIPAVLLPSSHGKVEEKEEPSMSGPSLSDKGRNIEEEGTGSIQISTNDEDAARPNEKPGILNAGVQTADKNSNSKTDDKGTSASSFCFQTHVCIFLDEHPVAASSSHEESAKHNENLGSVAKDTKKGAALKSDETQESVQGQHLHEEGRPLSAYELQRLERIKRNRQKLAQLGLGIPKQKVLDLEDAEAKKNKPARQRKSEPMLPQRARSIRAKKKSLNYAEPSASVRAIMKEGDGGTSKQPAATPKSNDEVMDTSERKRKWNRETERLPQDVYREFKRIKSHKRELLKEAQRAARNADKEVKYWSKRVERYEKTFLRKKDETDEKLALGGKTSRELIQILDERTPEIEHAIQEYEGYLYADQREHQRAINRREAEEKMKMLDALVRFPKALKVRFVNDSFLSELIIASS